MCATWLSTCGASGSASASVPARAATLRCPTCHGHMNWHFTERDYANMHASTALPSTQNNTLLAQRWAKVV